MTGTEWVRAIVRRSLLSHPHWPLPMIVATAAGMVLESEASISPEAAVIMVEGVILNCVREAMALGLK